MSDNPEKRKGSTENEKEPTLEELKAENEKLREENAELKRRQLQSPRPRQSGGVKPSGGNLVVKYGMPDSGRRFKG